jgi:hypothetical protein
VSGSRLQHEIEETAAWAASIEERLEGKTWEEDSDLYDKYLASKTVWETYGKAPDIDTDLFYSPRGGCWSGERHRFIPIIAMNGILGPALNDLEEYIEEIIDDHDDILFNKLYMEEFIRKVRGYDILSGDLYLLEFIADRYPDQKDRVLYLASRIDPPEINDSGLVCSSDGTPLGNGIYGSVNIPLRNFHYNQDERRELALKGELSLSHVGKLKARRNAFYNFSDNEGLGWSQIKLIDD